MKSDLTIFLSNIARQLALIPTVELEKHCDECANSIFQAEAFGCFSEPTAFIKANNDGSMQDAKNQLEIAKCLLGARRAIDKREEFAATKRPGRKSA